MNVQPFLIVPHFLYDWALQQKNPERVLAVVMLLARRANWGTGTWKKDGVVTHKGEVRKSIREISRELKLPFYSVREIIKKLEEAGFIELVRSEHGKKGYVSIFKIKWHNINQPLAQNSINETEKFNQQPNQVFNQSENKEDKEKKEIANQKINQQPNQPFAENQSTQTEKINHRRIRSNIEEEKEIEEKEEKNIEAGNKSANQKTENSEEEGRKENLGEENKEISPSLISLVIQNIVNTFKTEYKKKFNKYPLIDTASVKRVQETLVNSASNQEELKDLANHLLQKIPDFFKSTDKWVMQKGYSFFAFSWRIGDLLSEPVSYQATNTPGVEFACSGGWK